MAVNCFADEIVESDPCLYFNDTNEIFTIRIKPVTVRWSNLKAPSHIRSQRTKHMLVKVSAKEITVQAVDFCTIQHSADEPVQVLQCNNEGTSRVVTHVIYDGVQTDYVYKY
jgi:hypothetical protein